MICKRFLASVLLIYLFMAMLYLCEYFLCFMKNRHSLTTTVVDCGVFQECKSHIW